MSAHFFFQINTTETGNRYIMIVQPTAIKFIQ